MKSSWQHAPTGSKKMTTPEGKIPERRCISSGEVLPKGELIRCVVGPDQVVVPDVDEKLPGRGIWLKADRAAFDIACQRNLFSRAARSKVTPMTGLTDRVEELLAQRCLSLIGMMRRAGIVVCGYEKTRARLKGGTLALLLQAQDGAEDGRKKMSALAGDLPVIDLFYSQELASVLGRDHVVHVGLGKDPIIRRFRAECLRLQGFRSSD